MQSPCPSLQYFELFNLIAVLHVLAVVAVRKFLARKWGHYINYRVFSALSDLVLTRSIQRCGISIRRTRVLSVFIGFTRAEC